LKKHKKEKFLRLQKFIEKKTAKHIPYYLK